MLRWRVQVGITAMLIASKYEDIWAPEVRDFVYISDQAYTAEQILEMEKIMLNTLRFQLTVPTAYNFLARFSKAVGFSTARRSGNVPEDKRAVYATYLVELSMVRPSFPRAIGLPPVWLPGWEGCSMCRPVSLR